MAVEKVTAQPWTGEPLPMIWATSTDGNRRLYYLSIQEGETRFDFELEVKAFSNPDGTLYTEHKIEHYEPRDYDYTVHDGCPHILSEDDENYDDWCVFDDPESSEAQELAITEAYHRSKQKPERDERQLVREAGQAALDWQKLYDWTLHQPAGAILGQSCTNSQCPLCAYLGAVTLTRPNTWSVGPSIKTGYGDKLQKPEWVKSLIKETDKATGGQSGPVSRETYLSVLERVKPEDEV